MTPGFVTDATSGLSMVLTTPMSSDPGRVARVNSLLRAKTPSDVAALAADGAMLRAIPVEDGALDGSPTAVTRECYISGTGWEASARPRPSTQRACAKGPKDLSQSMAEPLSDWACCINTLRAAAAISQGEEGLDERLADLDATWPDGCLFLPLARDPRRRQTIATGVLRDENVRALHAVATACEDSGSCSMSKSGQLVGIRVAAIGGTTGQDVLGLTWEAFGRLRPRLRANWAVLEAETGMAAALRTIMDRAAELRTCPQCGSPFIAQNSKMTFCSPACRTANHRRTSEMR